MRRCALFAIITCFEFDTAQLLEDANLHAGGKHQKDYAVRVEEKLANMVVWNTQQEHNKMKRKVIVK